MNLSRDIKPIKAVRQRNCVALVDGSDSEEQDFGSTRSSRDGSNSSLPRGSSTSQNKHTSSLAWLVLSLYFLSSPTASENATQSTFRNLEQGTAVSFWCDGERHCRSHSRVCGACWSVHTGTMYRHTVDMYKPHALPTVPVRLFLHNVLNPVYTQLLRIDKRGEV